MLNEKIDKVLEAFNGTAAEEIRRAFWLMGIAEEEIAIAMKKNPAKAKEINAAFSAVKPYRDFWQATGELYAAHVKELLARIVKGTSLDFATDAEILWGLCRVSQKAPPSKDFSILYEKLFFRVLPAQAKKLGGFGAFGKESWDGMTNELYSDACRRLSIKDRGKEAA